MEQEPCRRTHNDDRSLGHAASKRFDAPSDPVTDLAERRKLLVDGAARRARVSEAPRELQSGTRRHWAVRVADGDDDIPALAHFIDGFARLARDVDAELAHRGDRQG